MQCSLHGHVLPQVAVHPLDLASFRFLLTMDTLVLGYTLPATSECSGLSSVRLRPYWAHTNKPGRISPTGQCYSTIYCTVKSYVYFRQMSIVLALILFKTRYP